MCIAIVNTSQHLSKKILKTCWENNPDGAGMAWVDKGEINVFKELTNFNRFYNAYVKVRSNVKKPMLIHFRIATSGTKPEINMHPFMISDKVAMIHNGTIAEFKGPYNDPKSDTYNFSEYLADLDITSVKMFEHPSARQIIYDAIGGDDDSKHGFNKIAMLDSEGNYDIFGEQLGVWDGKGKNANWFSNTGYRRFRQTRIGFRNHPRTRSCDITPEEEIEHALGVGAVITDPRKIAEEAAEMRLNARHFTD